MKDKVLITGYEMPDLDCVACAYAYAEFLQKKGINAIAAVSGTPHKEALFVMKRFKIPKIKDADKIVKSYTKVILVDASDLDSISKKLDPRKVIQIIDHREVHEADKFPNAKVHIELVGAAATLIAEEFYRNKMHISKKSAALLFSAIVSNTIKFQVPMTTDRDIKMAKWLKTKTKITKNYIDEMFLHKSKIRSLKNAIAQDAAYSSFNGKKIAIAQLEIVNAEKFVRKNIDKIRNELQNIRLKEKRDYVLLNCIDVKKAKNIVVALDDQTAWLLASAVNLIFKENIAVTQKILMRKQITPLLKEFLELST